MQKICMQFWNSTLCRTDLHWSLNSAVNVLNTLLVTPAIFRTSTLLGKPMIKNTHIISEFYICSYRSMLKFEICCECVRHNFGNPINFSTLLTGKQQFNKKYAPNFGSYHFSYRFMLKSELLCECFKYIVCDPRGFPDHPHWQKQEHEQHGSTFGIQHFFL